MSSSLILNGRATTLAAAPDVPLLWAIREGATLTGTKFGAERGNCGACTVHVDGQPTFACVMTVGEVEGREITTIEGVSGAAAAGRTLPSRRSKEWLRSS